MLAGGVIIVARPTKQFHRSRSPAEFACFIGFVAFVISLAIPATYVARHRRDAVAPPDEMFVEYVRHNWTEESGFKKAMGIGLAVGLATAAWGYVARIVRRRVESKGG
jgi:hypothetical protein